MTQTLSVIADEAYEAATDPDGSTGYWDPPMAAKPKSVTSTISKR